MKSEASPTVHGFHHAFGALLVAAGHAGDWFASADQLFRSKSSPDGFVATLGAVLPHLVDDPIWDGVKTAFRKLCSIASEDLSYGVLYELAGTMTEQCLNYRAHSISRLYYTLKNEPPYDFELTPRPAARRPLSARRIAVNV